MPGTPSAEDRLRARLHEVDDLEPPDAGFELRALRAGRDRIRRRQARARGLVAAAAVVVLGAVAVPALTRLGGTQETGGSSSAAGSAVAAPSAAKAGTPGDASSDAAGVDPNQPDVENVETLLVGLRSTLARTYPDAYTALVVDSGANPLPVTLHMTTPTPAAEQAVRAALPSGVVVTTTTSAYSSAQCQRTLARVTADRSTLTRQGYALGSLTCDNDGRVVVQVTKPVTPQQVQALVGRYGAGVTVEQGASGGSAP